MEHARELAPQTSIWLAWQGFNLSHSLGLLGLGAVGIALGLVRGALGPWLTSVDVFFVVVSVGYAVLALRFWFWVPLVGTAVAAACFAAAAVLP